MQKYIPYRREYKSSIYSLYTGGWFTFREQKITIGIFVNNFFVTHYNSIIYENLGRSSKKLYYVDNDKKPMRYFFMGLIIIFLM